MFPLLDRTGANPLELFQIWLNLPAADKMVEPYFTMLWREEMPRLVTTDDDGRAIEVTVVAGALEGLAAVGGAAGFLGLAPGGGSGHLADGPGNRPRAGPCRQLSTRKRYGPCMCSRDPSASGERTVQAPTGVVLQSHEPLAISAGSRGAEALVLQGRPIGEPVVQYGPFVMNDRAGIEQAFTDYRRTGFGGWPWPTDDPVHPPTAGRFARHPDGRSEHPE